MIAAGTETHRAKLADIQAELSSALIGSPLAGIADAADAGEAFLAADPDRQRAVIAELATVTVMPLGVGKRFTTESVRIDPRAQT
jgi:hypothetical protein